MAAQIHLDGTEDQGTTVPGTSVPGTTVPGTTVPYIQEIEALFQAARDILGATEVFEICQKLTVHFTRLVQADRVLIFLVDHERQQIVLGVSDGHVVDDMNTTYAELAKGLSGQVFRTNQPVLSLDAEDGIEPPETTERRKRAGTGAVLVVPLSSRGRVIGTVTAVNRIGQRVFTSHDVNLLMSLATQATVAIENAQLFQAEQNRRKVAELLLQAGRKLSSSLRLQDIPQRILEQLSVVVPFERGSLMLREGETVRVSAQFGFPDDERVKTLRVPLRQGDVFDQVANAGRPVIIDDVLQSPGWQQVAWLPLNLSWMGVPLFSQDQVIGMISLTRKQKSAFSQDDAILASTFALQAATALENANLYEEIVRFNEQLEQMVQQRTDELKQAYHALEKLNQNKSDFINVAAHELRTPLTVMKGYLGMAGADAAVRNNAFVQEALRGVAQGTERLYEIVNDMLDVARIDSQVLDLHPFPVVLGPIFKRVYSDFEADLHSRGLSLILEKCEGLPPIQADTALLLKVFQNVIGNAIKYTPDGGKITVSARLVQDKTLAECVEISVQDSGIGIDPQYHELIFEKFYRTESVALHSTGKTKFKGGGPGLGLSIARGIVQAHGGRIWVESPCRDETICPGSCFYILLPLTPLAAAHAANGLTQSRLIVKSSGRER